MAASWDRACAAYPAFMASAPGSLTVGALSVTVLLLARGADFPVSGAAFVGDAVEGGAGRLLSVPDDAYGYIDGEELRHNWDQTFVYLALLVGWFGAYVGFATTAARHTLQVENRLMYLAMVVSAGFAWGVCLIWSVYFVGMQALVLQGGLESRASARVPMMFHPSLTVISAFFVWILGCGGVHLLIRSRDSETSCHFGRNTVIQVLLSASVVGAAVAGMHGIGFMSQTGPFEMHINVGIMFACVIGAILVGGFGIGLVGWRPNNTWLRCVGAVFVSGSVCGMLFLSLEGCVYTVKLTDGRLAAGSGKWDIPSRDLAVAAFIVDLILLGISNYHTERMQQFVTGKAEELEKILRHNKYVKSASKLIRIAKSMRFPMALVPLDTFIKYGKMVRHEHLRDKGKLIFVDSSRHARRLRANGLILFFSHQWLAHDHPDPGGCQFQEIVLATKHLMRAAKLKPENVYIWVDYSSVPQEALHLQQLAIESLPMYVSCCSAFVIIAPQVMHANRNTPCNFTTYSDRLWCRLEVLCMILASMKIWRVKDPVETLPEEPSEAEIVDTSPTLSAIIGRDLNAANKQVFIWLQDDLHPLTFWTNDGRIQPCYENLLYIYEGDCTCCVQGHPKRDGEEIVCDKRRLVDVLTGVYGLMLVEIHKASQSKSVGSNDYAASRAFSAEIVRQRARIFPSEFFETRMEAMHQQVDTWKKTINDIALDTEEKNEMQRQEEAEEALGEDSSQNSGSDSESAPSSSGLSVSKDPTPGLPEHKDPSKFDRGISDGASIFQVDPQQSKFDRGVSYPSDPGSASMEFGPASAAATVGLADFSSVIPGGLQSETAAARTRPSSKHSF